MVREDELTISKKIGMFPRQMYPSTTLFESHNHDNGMPDMVDSELIDHANGFLVMFVEDKYVFIQHA